MLSRLQERIAGIVVTIPEADGFVLAGAGALIAFGLVDRATRDLDYFATSADEVDAFLPSLVDALVGDGLEVTVERASSGFARLVVRLEGAVSEVDLAYDYRLLPTEYGPLGPTLAAEEVAADKVLAIFGRAEPRDFADLAAVEPQWGLDHLLRRAAEKDNGFDLRYFLANLDVAERVADDQFRVPVELVPTVRAAANRWKAHVRSLIAESPRA